MPNAAGILPRGIPAASLKRVILGCDDRRDQRLPRGIPAASLKQDAALVEDDSGVESSAGIPAASLKRPHPHHSRCPASWKSSAGNTRGLIEARRSRGRLPMSRRGSSAGNTRGLIEAGFMPAHASLRSRLPRGIPAASLKRLHVHQRRRTGLGLPRGIPAASLKRPLSPPTITQSIRLPRGIPAASLKPDLEAPDAALRQRLPRGIPAASLKPNSSRRPHPSRIGVFRGEYPRPH